MRSVKKIFFLNRTYSADRQCGFASRLMTFSLALSLMTACTHSNRTPPDDYVSIHEQWPVKFIPTYGQLVIVNPFTVTCCGASPRYDLIIQRIDNSAGAFPKFFTISDLAPIDDFVCLQLKRGRYKIRLVIPSASSAAAVDEIEMENLPAMRQFLAADVDLRRGKERAKLEWIEEDKAMRFINQALLRLEHAPPLLPVGVNLSKAEQEDRILRLQNSMMECVTPA